VSVLVTSFKADPLHILSRYDIGDTGIPFCLQSVVKPLNYALTLDDLSPDVVHRFVGQEPSGRSFNELTLDYQRKYLFCGI